MTVMPAVQFAKALEAAGVISDLDSITRVIIDVDPRDAVKVYVQRIAGKQVNEVAGLLGEMMRDGRAKVDDGERPVCYWVAMAAELLNVDTFDTLAAIGLRVVEQGPWRDSQFRMVRIEDAGAGPELEGREVELVIVRHADGSAHVAERRAQPSRHAPAGSAGIAGLVT